MRKSKEYLDSIDFIALVEKYGTQKKACDETGISISTFNNRIKRQINELKNNPEYLKIITKKKILIFDIETTDLELIVRTYSLKNYTRYFRPDTINRDWTMLGAAWKWKGEDTAQVVSVTPSEPLNDEGIVRALYSVLDEADIIIGHNSDKFDIKKFNTRAIAYGLPPLARKTQIDTLKIARRYFAFTSNTLAYLADFLGVPQGKDASPNWQKCIEGCPDELRYMRKYNKQDVFVTEAVYDKIMSWHHTHPNIAEPQRDVEGLIVPNTCHRCGSCETSKRGFQYMASGIKYQIYSCNSCGSRFKGEKVK